MSEFERIDRCAKCGYELPSDEPGAERRACPQCGAKERTISASLSTTVGVTASVSASVERAVNEARMGGFALIVTTGVGVGFAVGFHSSSALFGILGAAAGAASMALLLALTYRVRFVRQAVMTLMHRITGR